MGVKLGPSHKENLDRGCEYRVLRRIFSSYGRKFWESG